MFGLALLFVYVFLLSFKHFDHLAWGRGSWSLCLSYICLLAMHALIYVTFSLPPGVGVGCGFCLWLFLDFSVYIFSYTLEGTDLEIAELESMQKRAARFVASLTSSFITVITCHESGCALLHYFYFFQKNYTWGVPNRTAIIEGWAHQSFIICLFYLLGTKI